MKTRSLLKSQCVSYTMSSSHLICLEIAGLCFFNQYLLYEEGSFLKNHWLEKTHLLCLMVSVANERFSFGRHCWWKVCVCCSSPQIIQREILICHLFMTSFLQREDVSAQINQHCLESELSNLNCPLYLLNLAFLSGFRLVNDQKFLQLLLFGYKCN